MKDSLHQRVIEVGLELPGTERYDFAEEWEALRVGGKWFALLSELHGVPIVNVKVDPVEGEALRQNYDEITPGHHMNKRHWVTVRDGDAVDDELLRELVTNSFYLVVESLPKRLRPPSLRAPSGFVQE